MRPPKTTAGPVRLWLPRLLSSVWACFDFVGASERLSRTGTTCRKRTSDVRWTGVGSVCGMLVGVSPAGCTSIRIATTLGYE
jgi:hypothetical protein